MSKDETCAGFHPDEIDRRMKEAAELGEARILPRPAVPEIAQAYIAELDDLIRWAAEMAAPSHRNSLPFSLGMAQANLLSAVGSLGAARAQIIAAVLS